MNKTIIEIRDIVRKNVTKKNGESATVVEVVDSRTQRKANTWDAAWTANWKLGDTIEVIFGEPKTWTDRNNVVHETWAITNPNAPKRQAPGASMSVDSAWIIAATLLAPTFVGKKIDLELVATLAEKVKERKAATATAAATPSTPSVPAAPTTATQPAPAQAVQHNSTDLAASTPTYVAPEDDYVEDEDAPF